MSNNFWSWFMRTDMFKKYEKIKEEHLTACRKEHDGTCIGESQFHFIIIPTSVACIHKVKCTTCGKEWSITGDDW